jgi:hypothetical protein
MTAISAPWEMMKTTYYHGSLSNHLMISPDAVDSFLTPIPRKLFLTVVREIIERGT